MGTWTSLVVLSVVAVSALGLPRPDRYNIPSVGNNRRSQYFVLHDDGSHKYGYDTGEDAFESQKTSSSGQVMGNFGYRDSDGQDVRLQYTSGQGGFVAQGDHIPKVHPDVEAVFASARARGPFVDPLAGEDGDRSYNFNFEGEEHSRNEVSDSDGTVRGSYSYIDEFGRTRTYTYRAGSGIGFVIEGDDIPQQVQPLASHTTSTQYGGRRTGSHTSGSQATGSATRSSGSQRKVAQRGSSQRAVSHASTQRKTSSHGYKAATQRTGAHRQVVKPSQTYFAPTQHSGASTRSSSASRTATQVKKTSLSARPATTRTVQRTSTKTRPFEAANTRASQSPTGRYSVAYETSSHTRQEAGDDNNNVRGRFTFVAEDDNVDRSVSYEASSATGFVASGVHLPIGPIVPGAPTGQVTGRIVPVVQTPFVDPLADGDLDASYDFGFESDTYSRSETADEDGNVSGTYSILGEDNILRTYRFRAGKGIGFETEEISATPSRRRSQGTVSSTHQQASRNQQTSSFGHGSSASTGSSSRTAVQAPIVTAYKAPAARTPVRTTFTAPTRGGSSSVQRTQTSSSHGHGTSSGGRRATFKTSHSDEVFPGFSLRQYDASEGHGKYGYVLKFDD